MTIRRNADGQQNLNDLRKELAKRRDVEVTYIGRNWTIHSRADDCWRSDYCPYYFTERQAIQKALFGQAESPEEAKYHATRSA
jgi:hypothetical protein